MSSNSEYTFSWGDLVLHIFGDVGNNICKIRGISTLINRARIGGIGKAVSYQFTMYSKHELELIEKLIRVWSLLNEISNNEWRSSGDDVSFANDLVSSLVKGEEISIFAVFCPSYKVGQDAIGYRGKVGCHTVYVANIFRNFIKKINEIGVSCQGYAYFCDLILENYNDLIDSGSDYKLDLLDNYNDFRSLFYNDNNIRVIKMSDDHQFNSDLGEKGLINYIEIDQKTYNQIYERNRKFYSNFLGWGDSLIRERTDVIISSYVKMGEILHSRYSRAFMFWAETIFERGLVYKTINVPGGKINVIYPKLPKGIKG